MKGRGLTEHIRQVNFAAGCSLPGNHAKRLLFPLLSPDLPQDLFELRDAQNAAGAQAERWNLECIFDIT